MKNSIRNLAIIATVALTANTSIAENVSVPGTSLSPLQAHTVRLENRTVVVYYTKNDNDSFNVITTVGPNPDSHGQITRHQMVVRPGDNYVFSIDTGIAGSAATTIYFAAGDSKLTVVNR